jgi:protein TonB
MEVLNILFKRSYWICCVMALGIHGVLLFFLYSSVEPPQYSLSKGFSSLELILLEAPYREKKGISPEVTKNIIAHREVTSKTRKSSPHFQKQISASCPHQQSFSASSGAQDVLPRYLHNPQPLYPEGERQQGHEGTVLLCVAVNEHGTITHLGVQGSSGYPILDQQALTTVKRSWVFYPAHRHSQAITSTVLIPIRFSLKD